jgi:hypothetical protein
MENNIDTIVKGIKTFTINPSKHNNVINSLLNNSTDEVFEIND